MTREWRPSDWGRSFTGSPDWRLTLHQHEIHLTVAGQELRTVIESESSFLISRGLFWTDITLFRLAAKITVDGLPNAQAESLIAALDAVLVEIRARENVKFLRQTYSALSDWLGKVGVTAETAQSQRRWITHEIQRSLEAGRPALDARGVQARLKNPGVRDILGTEATSLESSLSQWAADRTPYWAALNSRHTDSELVACKDLFDRVESKPLTEEQARAVVCFDNRVQVVASAGSGKTSTMVAKAAYAIHRGFVRPDQIVLLAFNKQAAEELQERAAQAFARLGMEGISVETSTFHALGLRIIGRATGEKPDIPDWATDNAGGFRKLSEIVDQLKDASPQFRTQWDLFRFVFGKSLPAFGSDGPPDVWDATGNGRILTANGERVRSQEEAEIANWLFYNGVEYTYESPYEVRTADEEHRQYRPDFFYPGLGLYHEHFALNARGQAPPHFKGYLEGVAWKRQLHATRGTSLFETTSHGIRSGADYPRLEKELTGRGIVLDPNPDRAIPNGGQKPMEAAELVGLVRTFISHAKSNCLTIEAMRQRLDGMPDDNAKHRHRMFLNIAGPVLDAWDKALAAEGGIDFEDMLNLAAEHLERGRYDSPFHLVMADEFQDASRARARLCRALVEKPGRFFFAVGDDWQSINRFAGADVSVMTGFREWFGHGQVLKLEQTFRCPQELCDVSSAFVSKNPAQIPKQVRSVTPPVGPVLRALVADHRDKLASAIDQFLEQLCGQVRDGTIPAGRNGRVSVFILGRYNADRSYLPTRRARFERWIDLSFLTMHRSKGSEADYVILPEMISIARGRSFPNNRADDPVLALAMPTGDSFPLGEERRLFYVALTRARRGVAMFTVKGQRSSFLQELEEDGAVRVMSTDGKIIQEKGCPACKQGAIIMRTGPYGEFESCSNYPICQYKPRKSGLKPSAPVGQPSARKLPAIPSPPSNPQQLKSPKAHDWVQQLTTSNASIPVPPAPKPNQSVAQPSEKKSGRITMGTVLSAMEQINRSVGRSIAMREATKDLETSLHQEKCALESALEIAEARIKAQEIQAQSPMHARLYQEAYDELSAAFEKLEKPAVFDAPKVIPSVLLSEYARRPPHPDPETHEAIQRKVLDLIKSRSDLHASIRKRLSGSPEFMASYKEELRSLGGECYWPSVNPAIPSSELKQLFERL